MNFWEWLTAALVAASAEPGALENEAPRAAASVAVAYAQFAPEKAPEPEPPPSKCVCGNTCKNGIWRPDGKIEQPCPCPATCDCKNKKGCMSGSCPKK